MTKVNMKKNIEEYVVELGKLLEDKKAENVVVLDVKGITSISDYFCIANCEVQVQLDSLYNYIKDFFSKHGLSPRNSKKDLNNGWIILDYNDFIVHLFIRELREFYNLERIWGEAKVVWPPGKRESNSTG